jgi:hypothetical protein
VNAGSARADRSLRRQQVALAWLLLALGVAAPLIDAPALWPLCALGGAVSALLLWGAMRQESVAAPVIGVVGTAVPAMYAVDRPAVGSLAAIVIAVMLGEHLVAMRSTAEATPGTARRWAGASSPLVHGAAAAAAAIVTMALAALPEVRVWSAMAVVALALVAVALQRRRAGMPDVPLPPPQRLG